LIIGGVYLISAEVEEKKKRWRKSPQASQNRAGFSPALKSFVKLSFQNLFNWANCGQGKIIPPHLKKLSYMKPNCYLA
jgi:hypothetical protein